MVAGPAWNKTLLLIVYDEHGGFYDHVPPPPAPKVSPEFPVGTLGVRVPAMVVSPWVAAGTVFGHDDPIVGGTSNVGATTLRTTSPVLPRGSLHFDHTSILKTIVRRFLPSNPPYLGARFAAAHDLSEVLGASLRTPQFLPFIRYRLQFVSSKLMLAGNVASRAPGTALVQSPEDGNDIGQDFSFEDAGGGFVHIRSRVGNLYVSARPPDVVGGTTTSKAAGTPGGSPAGAPASGPGVILDRKYLPPRIVVVGTPGPALQRWKLSPVGITVLDRDLYLISNEAYPNLYLQPAASGDAGSSVVLGAAGGTGGVRRVPPTAWRVTSPLIGSAPVLTH